jgi:hypothetical protein
MPALMALLATPTPFRTWLTRQSAARAVGQTQSPAQCPLATFLRAAGHDDVLVGRWEVSLQARLFPLPLWASHFVHQVDGLGSPGTAIRRREALALLPHPGGTLAA